MITEKLVRVLSIDVVGRKRRLWKILEVLGHDDIAAANNCDRQNMPIFRIG